MIQNNNLMIWYCDLISAAYNQTLPPMHDGWTMDQTLEVTDKALLWQETKPIGFTMKHPNLGTMVVLRGTDTALEWFEDAEVTPIWFMEENSEVEAGFAGVFDRIACGNQTFANWCSELAGPVLFTGHSLGAAVATLAAAFTGNAQAVTFACPLIGNEVFEGYALANGLDALHVVNTPDLVPRMPLGYERPGNALVFDSEALLPESAKVAFDAKPLFWHSLATYRAALVAPKARPQPF